MSSGETYPGLPPPPLDKTLHLLKCVSACCIHITYRCSELCFFKGLVSVDEDVEPLIGSALQRYVCIYIQNVM